MTERVLIVLILSHTALAVAVVAGATILIALGAVTAETAVAVYGAGGFLGLEAAFWRGLLGVARRNGTLAPEQEE